MISKNCILNELAQDWQWFCSFFSPITYSWEGGKLISENDDFEDLVVTREDYEEHGHNICEEKFDI